MRIDEILNQNEKLEMWQLINTIIFNVLSQNTQQTTVSQQTTNQSTAPAIPKAQNAKPYVRRPMVKPAAKPPAPQQTNNLVPAKR